MSVQFSTFDNSSDRKDLQVLFQSMGAELPEFAANAVRASWLQKLIVDTTNHAVQVDPKQCHPVGAYCLFVQITGVLGVNINTAAIALQKYVARKGWQT